MDSQKRLERLETLVSLLIDYINNNNINNAINDNLQLLADRRREALERHRINYYYNNNDDVNGDDSHDLAEDEIDGAVTI